METLMMLVWLFSFIAHPVPANDAIALRWQTHNEINLRGFVIMRQTGKDPLWQQVGTFVPPKGMIAGARYRFVDRSAKCGQRYTYQLRAVGLVRSGTGMEALYRNVKIPCIQGENSIGKGDGNAENH